MPQKAEFPDILAFLFRPSRYKVAYGGRGGSKCFALGTPVLMFDGTLRGVEDVIIGDKVMGPDSKPRTVLSTTSGESDLYEIKQTSAMTYVVNEDHILSLKKSKSCVKDTGELSARGRQRRPNGRYPFWPDITNITVGDYLKQSARWKEHFRGYRAGLIEFPEQDVLIDPYILGVWLGDGTGRELRITSADEEIMDACLAWATSFGAVMSVCGKEGSVARDLGIFLRAGNLNALWENFKEYGLKNNKHIPLQYISNSKRVRLELLAGLIDTDGTYRNHGYSITSANKVLAGDIKRLADTLGFRTYMREIKTRCGDFRGVAWKVSINGDVWGIPCKVERKKYDHNGIFPNKDKTLSYISVTHCGRGKYAGFSVDGDHLFCLADGTVTHNSWGFARALLVLGAQKPLRILCAREIQRSIRDSVHKLLGDQIQLLGLGSKYDVFDQSIKGVNGTEFIFVGLSALTVESIKSFEGMDIVWVEEGQTISKRSWDILIPTIRKDNSEIWVSFNPDLETDPTYERFVVHPPPDAVVVKVNWRDNPWFNRVLEAERAHCEKTDPVAYPNIWEGMCKPAVEGAIYFDEIQSAMRGGRIRNVPYDPMLKAHVVLDLGFNDFMSIAIVQRMVSEVRIIHYIEDSHRTLADYSSQLRDLRYNWGKVWLPFADGFSKDFKTGQGADQIMKALGWDVARKREVANNSVETGIKVTRMVFPRIYFDETHCERLIEALRRYRRHINRQTLEAGAPMHDEWSHGADCLRYVCGNVEKMRNEQDTQPIPHPPSYAPLDSGVGY